MPKAVVVVVASLHVQERMRILCCHQQQSACCAGWRTPTLLPFLQRSNRNAEQTRKDRLRQTRLLSDICHGRHLRHTTVLNRA
jgi:hypothetical protein